MPSRHPPRRVSAAAGALLLVACGEAPHAAAPVPSAPPGDVVAVTLSNVGCRPLPDIAPAGEVTFHINNRTGAAVSQLGVQQVDGPVIGMQQNLVPGSDGSLVVWLDSGTYVVSCPGASTSEYTFLVTGESLPDWTTQPALTAGVTLYVAYITQQAALLVTELTALDTAMHTGSLTRAQNTYAAAGVTFEHLEQAIPDASLDRAMNGFADDAVAPSQLSGFHRIELALWQERSTADGTGAADAMVADARTLQQALAGIHPQPSDITDAAVSSLSDAVTSRLGGEEEPFSHLGLLMMQADLDSAREAYECVRPWLVAARPALVAGIDAWFAAAQSVLNGVRLGDGFPPDTSLSAAQSRSITARFHGLAAAMSELPLLWSDAGGS